MLDEHQVVTAQSYLFAPGSSLISYFDGTWRHPFFRATTP
jgi:hypothetical protein